MRQISIKHYENRLMGAHENFLALGPSKSDDDPCTTSKNGGQILYCVHQGYASHLS